MLFMLLTLNAKLGIFGLKMRTGLKEVATYFGIYECFIVKKRSLIKKVSLFSRKLILTLNFKIFIWLLPRFFGYIFNIFIYKN